MTADPKLFLLCVWLWHAYSFSVRVKVIVYKMLPLPGDSEALLPFPNSPELLDRKSCFLQLQQASRHDRFPNSRGCSAGQVLSSSCEPAIRGLLRAFRRQDTDQLIAPEVERPCQQLARASAD